MNKLKVGDCNGFANVVTGMAIFSMTGLLLGKADPSSIIGTLTWMLCAVPLLIIAVVMLIINGDIVSALANGVLTGIALFNNIGHGLIVLYCQANNITLTEAQISGMNYMDGGGYFAAALVLIFVVYMSTKVNYIQAVFVALPCLGFLSFAATYYGIANLAPIGGVLISIFACWLLYSGCAMTINAIAGKQVIPYIYHGKKTVTDLTVDSAA